VNIAKERANVATKAANLAENNDQKMKWTFAKTYAKAAPHEWILREKESVLFQYIAKRIKENGVWEDFAMPGKKPYRVKYWYRGRYKYWVIMNVLNRAKIK